MNCEKQMHAVASEKASKPLFCQNHYDYHGKNITLNDKEADRYKEMNGGLDDRDIHIFLRHEKRQCPDLDENSLTETQLSEIVRKQIMKELSFCDVN